MELSMDALTHALAWAFMLGGALFMVIGGLGVMRMPDFFTRQHAAGITDTMAAGLILVALILETGFDLRSAKLVYILLFLLVTSPTSSHALAQAALSVGLVPEGEDWRKNPPSTPETKPEEPGT